MSNLAEVIFKDEITQAGLQELAEKYPANLVVDMTDDAEYKKARKTRTERNKLLEAIKRRRIDVMNEVKEHGETLAARVTEIFDVIVAPFELEDKRRKDEADRIKRELKEKLDAERSQIREIEAWVDSCRGKDSEYIQGVIEAVDLIETDVFHKDLIHEAIETKKKTLAALSQLLSDTIASEKLDAEREQLRLETRINKLRMMPTEYFGKPSESIRKQIQKLEQFTPPADEFGERQTEAEQAKAMVIQQLTMMADQQETIERVNAEREQAAPAKQAPGAGISQSTINTLNAAPDLDADPIAALKGRIKSEKEALPFAEGQAYRNAERDISELEAQLAKLESDRSDRGAIDAMIIDVLGPASAKDCLQRQHDERLVTEMYHMGYRRQAELAQAS